MGEPCVLEQAVNWQRGLVPLGIHEDGLEEEASGRARGDGLTCPEDLPAVTSDFENLALVCRGVGGECEQRGVLLCDEGGVDSELGGCLSSGAHDSTVVAIVTRVS